jgi:hypothetical protein
MYPCFITNDNIDFNIVELLKKGTPQYKSRFLAFYIILGVQNE